MELACEICGSESEILPSQAIAYPQALGEGQSSFPGEGRGWHVSLRVYVSAKGGVCRGCCLGGAGCREYFPGNAAPIGRHWHRYCTSTHVVWAPMGFSGPLAQGKGCMPMCLPRVRSNCLHLAGEVLPQPGGLDRGVSTLLNHGMSIPR